MREEKSHGGINLALILFVYLSRIRGLEKLNIRKAIINVRFQSNGSVISDKGEFDYFIATWG